MINLKITVLDVEGGVYTSAAKLRDDTKAADIDESQNATLCRGTSYVQTLLTAAITWSIIVVVLKESLSGYRNPMILS